jgi:hypothetical protein
MELAQFHKIKTTHRTSTLMDRLKAVHFSGTGLLGVTRGKLQMARSQRLSIERVTF